MSKLSKFRPHRCGDRRSLCGNQRIDDERIDRRRWGEPSSWIESPQLCRQVQRLHDLGARAVLELLDAAARGANIEDLLAEYGRFDPDVWRFDLPANGPIVVPDDLREMQS
jgi:hypothetical protein